MAATKDSYAIISLGGSSTASARGAPARRPAQDGRGEDLQPGCALPRGRRRRHVVAADAGDREGRRPRARRQDPDRQAPPEERLSQADGFSRISVADRDPVDRRHRQAHDGRRDSGRGEGNSRAEAESRAAPAPRPAAAAPAAPAPASPPRGYEDFTVADISEKSKRWKVEQLEAALKFEKKHANRKGAIAALESALAAKQEKN